VSEEPGEPVEPWYVAVVASAERGLARIPEKVALACIEFCVGPLAHDPKRLGKPLGDDLAGFLVARRGSYRIVYELLPEIRTVKVVRIEHRTDVYRSR
jgi:mRNA interferase RelE/StbE